MNRDKHLDALRVYWKRHKAFPSMAKLADVLGLASSGGVFKVLGPALSLAFGRIGGRAAAGLRRVLDGVEVS